MLTWRLLLAGASLAIPAVSAVGDADRGRQIFASLQCGACHSVAGRGGRSAPDLARPKSRGNTPADLSAAMWSHAPQMWAAMEIAGVPRPRLTTEQAADLFAWFQASRYFDKPGDPAVGRKLFAAKGCAGCHTLASAPNSPAPPVGQWESVSDAIELARQMWNHAPGMGAAMAAKGAKVPELTAIEMNDVITYLSSLPNTRHLQGRFSPGPADTGEILLQVKGCNECHKGATALPGRASYLSAAEIAAAMWNHAAHMKQGSPLRPEEMRRIAGYLWSRQFDDDGGDAGRGEKLFKAKGCAGCHGSGAPHLAHGGESSSYGLVAALWYHGPEMQRQMKAKGIPWPQFTGSEVSDVIAFLKTSR